MQRPPPPTMERRAPTSADLPASVLRKIVADVIHGAIPAPRFVHGKGSYMSSQDTDASESQRLLDEAAGGPVAADTLELRQESSRRRVDGVQVARCVCRYWRDCVDYSLVDYLCLPLHSAPRSLTLTGCRHAHLVEEKQQKWRRLSAVPLNLVDAGAMPQLESLVLSSKHLTELPSSFAALPLESLWLSCPQLGPWLESSAASSSLPTTLRSVAFSLRVPIVRSPIPVCFRKLVNLTDLDINTMGRPHSPEAPEWLSELPLRRFSMYEVTDAGSLSFSTELGKLALTSLIMDVDDAHSDVAESRSGVRI